MTALSASPAAPAFGRRGWVQSPAWDAFWMFSALWAGAALLGAVWLTQDVLFLGLLFASDRLLSVLHSWSTTYMVVASPLLADERRTRRLRFSVAPALIAAGAFALGLLVAATQRYPADGKPGWSLWAWGLYLGLFWVGHFWHFGNQDFGVLTIYRLKAGQASWLDRRVDKLYTVLMMFLIQPVVYLSLVRTTAVSEIVHTALALPKAVYETAPAVAVGAAALLSIAAAGFELSKPNRSLQKLLYIFVIFLHPTLLYGSVRAHHETFAYLYLIAYLWSHWLIATGLVARINTRYYESRGDSPGTAVARHFALLGAIAGVVFLLTERHKDYLLFSTDGYRYKQLLAAITPEQTLVIGLVLGFFLAEQLVHYYSDRCLFRLRDAAVRRKVAPLLLENAAPAR
jgi:hypothetical protein